MFDHRDIKDAIEPFWKGSAEDFLKELDFEQLKKLTPQEVINLARTQEELFALREFLQETYGSGSMWSKYYHKKREELGYLPSYDRRKNVFYAPLQPKRVLKPGGNPTNPAHWNVSRNLAPTGLSMAQITGKEDAFDIVNDSRLGPTLKRAPTAAYGGSAATRRVVTFDIETTGIDAGKGHQIVSLGTSVDGKKKSISFGQFPKKKFDQFIEKVIRPQWQKGVAAGGRVTSEKELIKDFIALINKKDTTVRGYNIKSFDVPFLYEAAKRHGLSEQFKMALQNVRIDDVVERAKHFLTERVGGQYIGFSKLASDHGLSSVGYKLEALAAGFGYSSAAGAHDPLEDITMTDFLNEVLSDPKKQKRWDINRWADKTEELTGSRPLKITEDMRRLDFSKHIVTDEGYYRRPFMEHAATRHPSTIKGPFKHIPLEEALKPKPHLVKAPSRFMPNKTLEFLEGIKPKPIDTLSVKKGLKMAVGVGGALAGIMLAGSALRNFFGDTYFSDSEPISEGKLDKLFGFSAPETSEEFFKREEDEQTQSFKAQLMGQQMGGKASSFSEYADTKFRPGELKPLSSTTAEIDLSKFNYDFVDADTLRLVPKNVFSRVAGRDPIMIRLSGLDAPETAHENRGAMPQAEAATAKLNKLIAGRSLRVVISTTPGSKTHGRYTGLAYSADSSKPLNLRLVEEGLAAAMTYNEGLINEKQYKDAERKAIKENLGIWQLDYYKQYRKERTDHRGRLGFNVLISAPDPDIHERRLRVKSSLLRRDEHLQVEGLDHYNIAQHVRHINTDFGSSWDIVRSIAKGLYKELDPEDAYQALLRNPHFRESIRTAAASGGTKLGAGLTAEVTAHKAVFKHGIADLPEEFEFAVKQYSTAGLNKEAAEDAFSMLAPGIRDALSDPESYKAWLAKANAINEPHSLKVVADSLQREQEALRKLGGLNAPSLYGTGAEYGLDKNAVIMERFRGEVIGNVPLSRAETSDLYGFIKESHKQGVSHTDLHAENIMRVQTPEGQKIGVLDYGMSNRLEKGASTTFESEIKDYVESASMELGIGDVSAKKFQEVIDINRVYAHALRGEASRGANIASERIAGIEGSFSELIQNAQSRDMSKVRESLMIVKDMLKTTDEAADFFGATKPFNIIDDTITRQTSLISPAGKTAVPLARTPAISGRDDAYNSIEGLHPNSVYGSGALVLKKTTDFGSGSEQGLAMQYHLQKTKGKSLDVVKNVAEKLNIPMFTKEKEALEYASQIYIPDLVNKGEMSEQGTLVAIEKYKKELRLDKGIIRNFIRSFTDPAQPHALSKTDTAFAFIKKTKGEKHTFLAGTHELLEVLHGKRIQTALVGKSRKEIENALKNYAFGTHETFKVIEDEAFLNYLAGDEQFGEALKLRQIEKENILKSRGRKLLSNEEALSKAKELRQVSSKLRAINKSYNNLNNLSLEELKALDRERTLITDLTSRKTAVFEELKEHKYLKKVEEIYRRAPQEAEEQMMKTFSADTFKEALPDETNTFKLQRLTSSDIQTQLVRQNKNRAVAVSAVGVGHEAAFNAGKKHCRFATKLLPKIGFGLLGVAAVGAAGYWLSR